MIHFDLPKQKSSIIKVLGVGGGGSNAVNFMHAQSIEGVDFIICNTDAKAIEQSKVLNKIQLGPHLTQGLGAGANPEVGKAATEESLQEIKSILEVNTKMAFITAGMGGGTGTGGAPIVAQVCKELGILTVGIVTTPFGFEGPRRMQQAEEGIRQLKPYVDTLLVISNDKLRMQYGNLKMKEAFSKADNVLATAAKCITDIINSRGHIIVDFADVCTVMKNGGVAILGKAEVDGENRAIRAIEEALTSPLLNDNDIKGAKWILININSAEGDDECTMDEVEVINNYLRMQAGENTDVIVGMGYDNSLDKKIGITLIATGFDAKDPFAKPVEVKKPEPKLEKIVMTLGVEGEEEKLTEAPVPVAVQEKEQVVEDDYSFAPLLNEIAADEEPLKIFSSSSLDFDFQEEEILDEKGNEILHFELSTEITEETIVPVPVQETEVNIPKVIAEENLNDFKLTEKSVTTVASHSFLSKPSKIYEEPEMQQEQPVEPKQPVEAEPQLELHFEVKEEVVEEIKFEVTEKEEQPQPVISMQDVELDEAEEQRKRAAERIQKLRNLSFNMNTSDPNNEFDSVPAYIRRNMELFGNTLTSVENFYSKYTVNKDENNNTHISTINTFLDGKKPD
ncbi:cell division protein FtsZ [mine drainage metagenome]|uniref:Cell division protein FtsZ n=1 Tax=mine drainage metagenome TaxID=410659 RepID=A0A1J5S3L1_9ZZZZ